jgi:hypothetical protein
MQACKPGPLLVATLLLGLVACGSNDSAETGCAADRDCPGMQICEMRACVALPGQTGNGAAAMSMADGGTGSGCQKDVDCKGDRICVAGACADPQANPTPGTGAADAGVQATIKFCHELLVDNVDVTLTMSVVGKSLPALTHGCSPCQTIPANQLLDYKIFHPSGESLLDFRLALEPGDHVFLATVMNTEPTLRWGKARSPATCASVDPFASRP